MHKKSTQTSMMLAIGVLVMLCLSCSKPTKNDNSYPNRPIEVIVPFGPGGGSDTFARLIKAEIERQNLLPHPLVIINAPGAGGTVGSRRVLNEKPDGYTVLLLHDGILTARRTGKVLYGPSAFDQVAGTGQTGMVIAVHEDSLYQSLPDLLDAAAQHPDSVTFAANLGAPSHFIGLVIEQEHGAAKFRYAQSGGGADRFAAIKGKHVEATSFSLEEYLRFKPDGIRALAYLGTKRHHQVPELATAIEQGVNVKHSTMQYWWMPKGSPQSHVEGFARILERVMESDNLKSKLSSMKIDPVYLTGSDLRSHLRESEVAFSKVEPGTDSPLPNVPLALAGLTLLFGLSLGVQRVRRDDDSDPELAVDYETNLASIRRWSIVALSTGLVVVYALFVIVFDFPLGVMTAGFLFAMGLLLSIEARKTNPVGITSLIVVSSLVVGTVFHFVFTKLFEIGL